MSGPAPGLGDAWTDLPRAFGLPPGSGVIRTRAEDFQVDEILGFEPAGEGDHVLLRVRKRDANTAWCAQRIARHAGVSPVDVGYAGLKDRHALTTQWFSVGLAARAEPDWAALNGEGMEVLEAHRHRRKLRKGALRGNRFRLWVRQLEGSPGAIDERLGLIRDQGVPNYFGAQRFGREGGNLRRAAELLAGRAGRRGRQERGLYYSAARSLLFNRVLAERVARGCWNRLLEGDVLQLEGSRRWFPAPRREADLLRRVAEMDLHPTGPLWGRGSSPASGEAARIECEVLEGLGDWCAGLERAGLEQERRPLRVVVAEPTWGLGPGGVLEVGFRLPAGSYATAVLRECLEVREAARGADVSPGDAAADR